MEHWTALTENEKGFITFYHKWVDGTDESINSFEEEVRSQVAMVLAIYREEDVIAHCEL